MAILHGNQQIKKGALLLEQATAMVAAATVNFNTINGNSVDITGNTTITSFGTVDAGAVFDVRFTGAPLLTHNATSLQLPTEANIQVVAGDRMRIRSLGAGNWTVVGYLRQDGRALVAPPDSPTVPAIFGLTTPAGESLAINDSVFIEVPTTFALATVAQDIGKGAINTRLAIPCFGSAVSATTMKLALGKVSSPSVNLGIRIETDNGSGNPSGTLVHANATATVTPASLTTSLADTTITFAGAFTITSGQKCHIVLFQGTYGSETVNSVNHYTVGSHNQETRCRKFMNWNGTTWAILLAVSNTTGDTLPNGATGWTNAVGYRILTTSECILLSVTKVSGSTTTRAVLKNNAGTILATATFVGNIATFTPYILATATNFRVECDANGGSHTGMTTGSPANPSRTFFDYLGGSLNGANWASVGNVVSIEVGLIPFLNHRIYNDSTLFARGVLGKTNASFAHQIDFWGFTSEAVSNAELAVGKLPKVVIGGVITTFTGLTEAVTHFLSNTAGLIATTAGTNSRKIGRALPGSTTTVKIVDLPL